VVVLLYDTTGGFLFHLFFELEIRVLFIISLPLLRIQTEHIKLIIIFFGLIISLRYFWWRTFNTINLDEGFLNAIFSILLYLAELYSLIILLLGSFISLRLLDRKPIPIQKREDYPTVDVFIPTYNEPVEIVMTTALAAVSMDYPKEKFNVYILDDGGTTQKLNDPDPEKRKENYERAMALKSFVKRVGGNLHYLTREKNLHAKAGNINEALKKTNGDLILILDCDHTPAEDFLKRTVGFFNKYPKMFLVQTPHSFYNPDPIEKNLGIFKIVPSEADMFYKHIQKGLDFWSASFFCGSAAILRRKYLLEVGGIQGNTITEDAETALELHSRGYDSGYYARPMVYGLQPETFSAFVVQRTRWAQGMIQIFLLKNPLFKKGLKWYQKLSYLNANIFWFFGFARFIFLIAPVLYPILGVRIYNASLEDAMVYAIPHFIFSILVSYYLYAKTRWNFFSEIYEAIQSIFILPAIISVILNPRKPTFKVTPKGENLEEEFLTPFYKPVYILFHIIVISFFFSVYRWINYPDERGTVLIVLFWQIFNFLILGLGISILLEKPQRRKAFRVPSNDEAFIYINSHVFSGKVRDVSLTGIWIETDQDITPYLDVVRDAYIKVMIKDVDNLAFTLDAKVVNANSKNIRATFLNTNDIENITKLVKVVYSDSSRWEIFREELTMGPIKTFLFLTKLFFKTFSKAYVVATQEFIKEMKEIRYKDILKSFSLKLLSYGKIFKNIDYKKYLKGGTP
ncbi:UDP-forming cellulose synthase catalytic subunit, partial [Sulfurihydrogenibium sp.]|uniref:UDP-forming cellulose synthase catalytic subunit n=1 Tax=Sulfurihydrogenibium sp. TaxID=2053621 RepID=UPI0026265BF9